MMNEFSLGGGFSWVWFQIIIILYTRCIIIIEEKVIITEEGAKNQQPEKKEKRKKRTNGLEINAMHDPSVSSPVFYCLIYNTQVVFFFSLR